MSAICNAGKSYGMTVRVPQAVDLRRFPALPRATKKFHRLYKGRTAVERVNARLKVFWGVDDGNLRGARRFSSNVGAVLVVHAAFATLLAPRREGTLGKLRLSPIAQALQARIDADHPLVPAAGSVLPLDADDPLPRAAGELLALDADDSRRRAAVGDCPAGHAAAETTGAA